VAAFQRKCDYSASKGDIHNPGVYETFPENFVEIAE